MKMVVAQMYNCIRMEFRKCFHSHNFIISMATCVLLALSSASYCCQGYLNIVATFLYFFLCWILLLINCLLYGGQFTLSVSPYMSDIFLLRETVPPDQWNVCHVLLLMPPLIASSFGILQMLLTLWFRPIICFLISAILMLASAYFCVPVLILNYAFCIRSNEILVDGFSFPSGIVYALALSLLCMFIGATSLPKL